MTFFEIFSYKILLLSFVVQIMFINLQKERTIYL